MKKFNKGMVITSTLAAAIAAMTLAGCGNKAVEVTKAETAKAVQAAANTAVAENAVKANEITAENKVETKKEETKPTTTKKDTKKDTKKKSDKKKASKKTKKSEKTDIIVPIATSTAQTAKAVYDGEKTPIVFAAVSDPVAAGLTGEGSEMITGVSNNIPADEIVKLVYNFQPECKKIGFVYTSSETNSVSTINSAKKYCDENGIAYEETSISNVSELQTAVESLLSKGVEALYTGNDNTIASAMATYTSAAYPKQIPIYCGADSMVADGGFATVGVNYVQLGEQVAEIVKRIKAGEQPSDIPYETLAEYAKFVNKKAVKDFSGDFPESAYEGFEVLVEEDGTSHFNQ